MQRKENDPEPAPLAAPMPHFRLTFAAVELLREHPPRLNHPLKKRVFSLAHPEGALDHGEIVASRWPEMRLPEALPAGNGTRFEARPDIFGYEPAVDGAKKVEWYLNFADTDLFFGYSGPLFAQDEIQVAEHPALGAVREALLARKIERYTTAAGRPTPVLVSGVERRCRIATDRNGAEGRPNGLYGMQFSRADGASIERAVHVLNPPTISNIIAIAAPQGGNGKYTRAEIQLVLATAYTGFRAAKRESEQLRPGAAVWIHTGHWGCGAFGGNHVLMALLQLTAARLSDVDGVVFHTFNEAGMAHYRRALDIMEKDLAPAGRAVPTADLIRQAEALGFAWGTGDGN